MVPGRAVAGAMRFVRRKRVVMTGKILGSMLIFAGCMGARGAEESGRPAFSWETVPVYVHFGKTGGPLTEEELRFVAGTSNFVCLEKGHGGDRFGSTEKGIVHDARRLKAVNPNIKVLFYWNAFLNYPLYDACTEFQKHPEWLFRDKQGQPIYKTRRLEQYNLLNADFRRWWASVAGKAVKEHGCDGIFMDAVDQAKRAVWIKRGWGEENKPLLTKAVMDMMKLCNQAMGDDAILLYNGIRSLDREGTTAGQEYLPYADGAIVEHFAAFGSRTKESIARDIESITKAGKAGKIVVVKGWPDEEFNWTNERKMALPQEELAGEAKRKITFPLACFLIAAQEHSYFCYSWGYRERHGSLVDYPEFHKRLGKPKGDATRNGWIYTRSFEHASVRVDLSEKTARIDWE